MMEIGIVRRAAGKWNGAQDVIRLRIEAENWMALAVFLPSANCERLGQTLLTVAAARETAH